MEEQKISPEQISASVCKNLMTAGGMITALVDGMAKEIFMLQEKNKKLQEQIDENVAV